MGEQAALRPASARLPPLACAAYGLSKAWLFAACRPGLILMLAMIPPPQAIDGYITSRID